MSSSQDQNPVEVGRASPPTVSVICTAKNAATTIEATINSILAQDFQDWEMIIVDDGSTDDTVSIVRGFASADPRIRLVTTNGLGRGRALNRALAEAEADLIANLDADDETHPSRLRYQLAAMAQYPQFPLMFTKAMLIGGAARPVWPKIDGKADLTVNDVTSSLTLFNPVPHSSAMMRKAAIVALGGYDEARRFVFDYDLWVRAAAAGLHLGRLELPLVAKRIHPGQAYLHASRGRYLLASAQVQWRAGRALCSGRRYRFVIVLRMLWATLPLSMRIWFRNNYGALSRLRSRIAARGAALR